MNIQAKIIALLLAIIGLASAFLGYGHYQYAKGVKVTTATYEAAIGKQKAEAATLLASETAKVRGAEQALQDLKNNQELRDAEHQKTIAAMSDRLRRLAGPAGRLRDPNAAGCGRGGSGPPGQTAAAPADRPADQAEAGGLLSAQLSGLLGQLTREADEINNAYTSCRSDAYTVRSAPEPG